MGALAGGGVVAGRIFSFGLLLSPLLGAPLGHAETSTGTGFAVSDEGDLVTNEHVISECTVPRGGRYFGTLNVHQGGRSYIGSVRASDKGVDLAIVRLSPTTSGSPKPPAVAVFRQSPPLRAGDKAIAYGFPLTGALSTEGNVTIGNVSALRGLADDPKYIQITTPIQPGNSGGPLLDGSGNVIGVTAAKLNAIATMRAIGDLPENVNFAIELGTLRRFLQAHGVTTREAPSKGDLPPADIGDRAKLFTYLIECKTPSTVPPQAQIIPAGSYLVQISSQRSEDDAQASFHSLQAEFPNELSNREAIVRRTDLAPRGIFYRVFVGPFRSAGEADQFCYALKVAGGQCIVQLN
jgi:hypothetical protein